ncbi:MAG TPA: glycoside hydrolase family 16 protein, partial [Sphingomonas sp.]|nr:glycoside hydrolase family 16 protein [Sphingomonas sp.]
MRRAILFAAVAVSACATSPRTATPVIPAPAGYRLVWNDEFDRPGRPDPARWAYATDRNAVGWGNRELQYYSRDRRENARIERGVLVIEARREPDVVAKLPQSGGQAYSSARLRTPDGLGW